MKTLVAMAAAVALTLSAAASAATLQDLQALGYTVAVAGPYPAGCTTYTISGHGVTSEYISLCSDPTVQATVNPGAQAAIDSLANPLGLCNADWQINHPDQLAAYEKLGGEGYVVTGDQCADSYAVTNSYTGQSVYQGPGAGLVAVAGSLPNATATAQLAGISSTPIVTGSCLPACPAPIPVAVKPPAETSPSAPAATSSAVPSSSSPSVAASPDPVQTVTVTVSDPISTPLAATLSAKAGMPVTIPTGTVFSLFGRVTTRAKVVAALQSRHRVRVTGHRHAGKLIASRVSVS